MAPVDLDYVQGRLDLAGERYGFVLLPIEDGTGMIAELRAARELFKAAEPYEEYIPPQDVPPGKHPLADALAVYRHAIGGGL